MKIRAIRVSALLFVLVFSLQPPAFGQTTPVLFPLNSLFGGAAVDKPLTITTANSVIWDGQNFWAGTYTVVPASPTNPIVSLYPASYLLTIQGVVQAVRFNVPATTNVWTMIPSSGPDVYFGTNILASLNFGSGFSLITNADGSITISSTGGSGGGGTPILGSSSISVTPVNGSNQLAVVGVLTNNTTGNAATATTAVTATTATTATTAASLSGTLPAAQLPFSAATTASNQWPEIPQTYLEWWSASDQTNSDGQTVNSAIGKNGNMLQGNALFRTTYFNGFPCWEFDYSTTQLLTNGAIPGNQCYNAATCFLLYRDTATNFQNGMLESVWETNLNAVSQYSVASVNSYNGANYPVLANLIYNPTNLTQQGSSTISLYQKGSSTRSPNIHLLTWSAAAGQPYFAWVDGKLVGNSTIPDAALLTCTTPILQGALQLGSAPEWPSKFQGWISDFLIYTQQLSVGQINAINNALLNKVQIRRDNINLDGDSVAFGGLATGLSTPAGILQSNFPAKSVTVTAVSGRSSANDISNMVWWAQSRPHGNSQVNVIWYTLQNDGFTSTNVFFTNYTAECAMSHSNGYLAVIVAPYSNIHDDPDGIRTNVICWLQTNWWNIADGFLDSSLDPRFGAFGTYTNTAYIPDGVHGTNSLFQLLVGNGLTAVLNALYTGNFVCTTTNSPPPNQTQPWTATDPNAPGMQFVNNGGIWAPALPVGNGAGLTNLNASIVTSGNGNVTVTPTTNATTGQITYSVAATGGSGGSATNLNLLNSATVTWSTPGGSNQANVVSAPLLTGVQSNLLSLTVTNTETGVTLGGTFTTGGSNLLTAASSNNLAGPINTNQVYPPAAALNLLGSAAFTATTAYDSAGAGAAAAQAATNNLGSAAFTAASAYDAAGAAQKATNNLGSAAFTASTAYDASGAAQAATNNMRQSTGLAAFQLTNALDLAGAGASAALAATNKLGSAAWTASTAYDAAGTAATAAQQATNNYGPAAQAIALQAAQTNNFNNAPSLTNNNVNAYFGSIVGYPGQINLADTTLSQWDQITANNGLLQLGGSAVLGTNGKPVIQPGSPIAMLGTNANGSLAVAATVPAGLLPGGTYTNSFEPTNANLGLWQTMTPWGYGTTLTNSFDPTNSAKNATNGLGSAAWLAANNISANVATNLAAYPTNFAGTALSFSVPYQIIITNAAFSLIPPTGFSATAINSTACMVTNKSGSVVVITPCPGWNTQGTWNVTNVSAISLEADLITGTNAVCVPFK